MFDLIIAGGMVADGSGAPAFRADVGVRGGEIAAVAPDLNGAAGPRLDASGCLVAPGFIDVHAHDDLALLADPALPAKAGQGVTTVIIGNCGLSPAPCPGQHRAFLADCLGPVLGRHSKPLAWESFTAYLDELSARPLGLHAAALVGHGTLRLAAMGPADRPPTPAEQARMCALLDETLAAGACGLSLGLQYVPGLYARKPELVALSKVLARRDALLTVHMRSYQSGILAALEEVLAVGAATGVKVQISHLKVSGGPANWPRFDQVWERIHSARARGTDVMVDAYPYSEGSSTMTLLFPRWASSGGTAQLLKRLEELALHRQILADWERPWDDGENLVLQGGWERILIASPGPEGLSIAEAAAAIGRAPGAYALDLYRKSGGQVTLVFRFASDAQVDQVLASDLCLIGSDGLPLPDGLQHPRHHGCFPRFIARMVREQGSLTMEQAVRRLTDLPARRFRLKGRGLIAPAYAADLVVFDPAQIRDQATFASPRLPPQGIRATLARGRLGAGGEVLRVQPEG